MNEANAYAARISAGGSGCRRRRAPDDDAERSLRADEQLREIGSDRGARRAAGRDDRAVGEHDVEAHDDVLDLAVAGRELAGAAAREPAADGRQRHRLRPVPARDAVLVAELVFEHVAERARQHVDEHRRVIDVDDALQRGEVEQHAAEHRNTRAAHAAPTGGGGNRNRARRCTRAAPPRPRRASAAERSTDARVATWSSSAQIIASGHQSRLASPISAAAVETSAPVAASCSCRVVVDLDPRRAAADHATPAASPANAIGGVGAPRLVSMRGTTELGGWVRERVERGLGQAARRPFGRRSALGTARPGGRARRRSNPAPPPSARRRRAPRPTDASRASRRARVRRESTSSTVRAISVAHRVHDFGLGSTGARRRSARRAWRRRAAARAPRARRRRSAWRDPSAASAESHPDAPCSEHCLVRLGRRPATPSSFTATSMVSAAMRRYVVSLPPVTVITPPADARTE